MKTLAERFESKISRGQGCWLWTGYRDRNGYGRIGHAGKVLYAHRVAWEMKNGPIPKGMCVCHHCDNPPCVRHLFLGTDSDNSADKMAKGRGLRGEAHSHSKLTEAKVRKIRASREPIRILALRFGISQPTASKVRNRRTWRHVC